MVRVWEYDVPETSRAEFERTYGAAGDWVQLFSSSDGFRGTELFVSLSDPGRYLTLTIRRMPDQRLRGHQRVPQPTGWSDAEGKQTSADLQRCSEPSGHGWEVDRLLGPRA